MKIDYDKIYISASQARENAYAPYSRFSVGAAVLLRDGRIVAGANVKTPHTRSPYAPSGRR